ncbi:MAG TPA: hypothetical protein ENN84_08210, partial [Candidatus Marinimicrobia bacterium]|nr:hypothetical protein [Candidatus Neomarinimicrobiota bacterium]
YESSFPLISDYAAERKSLQLPQGLPSSWEAVQPGSPGFPNSQNLPEIDLAIRNFSLTLNTEKQIEGALIAVNLGEAAVTDFLARAWIDLNQNSEPDSDETQWEKNISHTLSIGDTLQIIFELSPHHYGSHPVMADLLISGDSHLENNGSQNNIHLPIPKNSLIINEFMREPGERHGTEYIEVYNISDKSVNLQGIAVSDMTGTIYLDSLLLIPPGEYGVLAQTEAIYQILEMERRCLIPKSWRVLNNSEDLIRLGNPDGCLIDSLFYDGKWKIPQDFAAERVNPYAISTAHENWASVQYGSPGLQNPSLAPERALTLLEWQIEKTSSDSLLQKIILRNSGLTALENIQVNLYQDLNFDSVTVFTELIQTKFFPQTIAPGDTLISKFQARLFGSGIYDLFLESDFFSVSQPAILPYPEPALLINELIPIPNDEAEWMELLNISRQPVNLRGWKIADPSGSATLSQNHFLLAPGEYLLLSSTEDVRHNYPGALNAQFLQSILPSQNNVSDRFFLLQPDDMIADSAVYGSPQLPKSGISFERIDELHSAGWAYSIDYYGATPGRENSIFAKKYQLTVKPLTHTAKLTDSILTIFTINSGYRKLEAGNFILLNYKSELLTEKMFSGLSVGDTLIWNLEANLLSPDGWNEYYVQFTNPQHSQWDTLGLFRSWETGPLFLNEVHSDPEPEHQGGEFLEFRLRNYPLDLGGFSLHINARKLLFPETAYSEYLLLSSDSSYFQLAPAGTFQKMMLPALPNEGAIYTIWDAAGMLIDSLDLRSHNALQSGVSLERAADSDSEQSPDHWQRNVSQEGYTPGRPNSVFSLFTDADGMLIEPRIFSVTDAVPIRIVVTHRSALSHATLRIFDVSGRYLFQAQQGAFHTNQTLFLWDGKTRWGSYPSKGLCLLYCEIIDADGKKGIYKGSLVIKE